MTNRPLASLELQDETATNGTAVTGTTTDITRPADTTRDVAALIAKGVVGERADGALVPHREMRLVNRGGKVLPKAVPSTPQPQPVYLILKTLYANNIAAAAARIAANLNNRMAIPPTIPSNYGDTTIPTPLSSSLPLAITAPPPPPSYQPAPPPPSSGPMIPAPPPPSIGVIVKKDERGPLGDVYQQDGDWMKDIEINNLRNRYLLTKGATQQQVYRPTILSSQLSCRHRQSASLNADV